MPPTSKPTNINKEISILRSLISRTRRQINDGTADPVQGGRLIAQTSIALSKLILAQHHITPGPIAKLEQELIERREAFDNFLHQIGFYWTDPPLPQPETPHDLRPLPRTKHP